MLPTAVNKAKDVLDEVAAHLEERKEPKEVEAVAFVPQQIVEEEQTKDCAEESKSDQRQLKYSGKGRSKPPNSN